MAVFIKPFTGKHRVTDDFQAHKKRGSKKPGTDWAMPIGTPILASRRGKVTIATTNGKGAGTFIEIRHSKNIYRTRYKHLSKLNVKVGQTVMQGEIIGWSGNTGDSTGPHLHFEMTRLGVCIDAEKVIA